MTNKTQIIEIAREDIKNISERVHNLHRRIIVELFDERELWKDKETSHKIQVALGHATYESSLARGLGAMFLKEFYSFAELEDTYQRIRQHHDAAKNAIKTAESILNNSRKNVRAC